MRIRIDLKIFIFLIIFYFTNQLKIYLVVMFFCIIHEIGHIVMGLILKMQPKKMEIMPCGLCSSFYYQNNKIKEILVTLAGPLTSLSLVFLCKYIDFKYITKQDAIYSNILILIFNLIPLYPLDGGRIIKAILQLKYDRIESQNIINKISNVTIIILTIISSISVYYYKNISIFLICIFLWLIILREKNDKTLDILHRK